MHTRVIHTAGLITNGPPISLKCSCIATVSDSGRWRLSGMNGPRLALLCGFPTLTISLLIAAVITSCRLAPKPQTHLFYTDVKQKSWVSPPWYMMKHYVIIVEVLQAVPYYFNFRIIFLPARTRTLRMLHRLHWKRTGVLWTFPEQDSGFTTLKHWCTENKKPDSDVKKSHFQTASELGLVKYCPYNTAFLL